MLNKIGNVFLSEERIEKFKYITNKLFIVGLLVIIFFPSFSKKINIIEKFYMNSSQINYQNNFKDFQDSYIKYMKASLQEINNDDVLKFSKTPFINNDIQQNNIIYTKNFNSVRGAKRKFIMINLIYEKTNLIKENKSNAMFYSFMKFLSDKQNIQWLSKDIQINYVNKKLFYENIYYSFDLLTSNKNTKIESGQTIESIFNFDLSKLDLEKINKILLNINGLNSECLDLDIYKLLQDNFNNIFQENSLIVNTKKILSKFQTNFLKKFFTEIGSIIKTIYSKYNPNDYSSRYLYIINNLIYNNLFIDNSINLNHLLISNNYNSIFIEIIPKIDIYQDNENNAIKFRKYFYFIIAFERIIKTFSKNEIDDFRGEFFYIISDSNNYIDYFHLVPIILLVLRLFYEIVSSVYLIEFKYIKGNENLYICNKNKNISQTENIFPSKILSMMFFNFFCISFIIFHFEQIHEFFKFNNIYTTYKIFWSFIIFVTSISIIFTNLNKQGELFIENIMRFIVCITIWTFITYNIGIGLISCVLLFPIEEIIIYLKEHYLKRIIILGLYLGELYFIFSYEKLIEAMLNNYIIHKNSLFILVSYLVFIISLKIGFYLTCEIKQIRKIIKKNYKI